MDREAVNRPAILRSQVRGGMERVSEKEKDGGSPLPYS